MTSRSTSRLSTDSSSSHPSDETPPSSDNNLTSALIRIEDRDNNDEAFMLSDEDDLQENSSGPEVVLPPSIVFGYFLSPCLKLGVMLILSSQTPLKISIPALLVFSSLSVFARQIWFLLARYVRRSDVGDIVAEAVARGRRKAGIRVYVRAIAQVCSGMMRILLATVYFKGAKSCIEPLWPDDISLVSPSFTLSVVYIIFLTPIALAPNLASRRLVYTTGVSNALYIIWLCAIVYAHATGALNTDNVMVPQGRLLQDISSVAFAFSSLSNLHIFAGTVGSYTNSDKKEKRYLSVSSISFYATAVGTGLVLPVLFPSVKSHGDKEPSEDSSLIQALIATLTAFILLLAIPPLLTTSPFPVPSVLRRITSRPLGRYALVILLFALSLLPGAVEPILEDATVLLVLLSTYFLPALLHIILHNLRRPMSIIVDPRPLLRSTSGIVSDDDDELSPTGHDRDTEELLLRKERALQRRRLGRRVMWDIGVWILLVPVGGGGFTWAIGRFANVW